MWLRSAARTRFHATLFEFLRNDALDGHNYFSTAVDPLKRNPFGFVASGPLFLPKVYNGKDKLFWMLANEGTRRRQAVTSTNPGTNAEGARWRYSRLTGEFCCTRTWSQ